jgi:cyclophilin family peptidyl-prolyl cis-trans isomerase
MIQGGDPTGTGSGGPGYRFADENFTRKHQIGSLSMANAVQTLTQPVFHHHIATDWLNGKHTVFVRSQAARK